MQAKVSIIIPVYNVEHYFEKCLYSLFEQTLDDIEYIFVNDCTPDDSMSILYKLIEKYPHRKNQIRVIDHKYNMGLGQTRKDGMKMASGKYVISCDSDDWVENDMYGKMYAKAIEENADIVCCGYYLEYPNRKIKKLYPYTNENRNMIKKLYIEGLYSALWNKLIKRELYVSNNIYPFDGVNMWEDLSVTIRLRYLSKKTVVINEPLYHYNNCNASSIVSTPNISHTKEQIQCALEIEKFFCSQNAYEEYFLSIQNIKFLSKKNYLFVTPICDLIQWKNTFPETNKYIWKYHNISIHKRIIYWMSACNFFFFVSTIIDLRYWIKRTFKI
jgi:glycosyltransferase involved in cell wall biosynthesis